MFEFLKRRHDKPDYELDVYITGVCVGTTGKVHWQIEMDEDTDKAEAALILEKAAMVLKGDTSEDLVPNRQSQ